MNAGNIHGLGLGISVLVDSSHGQFGSQTWSSKQEWKPCNAADKEMIDKYLELIRITDESTYNRIRTKYGDIPLISDTEILPSEKDGK